MLLGLQSTEGWQESLGGGGGGVLTGTAGGAACSIGSGCHKRLFFCLTVTPQRILPTINQSKSVLSI